jgi:hypothetical protein
LRDLQEVAVLGVRQLLFLPLLLAVLDGIDVVSEQAAGVCPGGTPRALD